MSKLKLLFAGRVDQQDVSNSIIESGTYPVEIIDDYSGYTTVILDLGSLDDLNLKSFLSSIDNATFKIEEDAFVWKIAKTGKEFSFGDSYIRDSVSTELPLTPLNDGTPLKLKIEVPGFTVNDSREIDLWYNQPFNPSDLDLMAEIGIGLTGDGSGFEVINDKECRVSFRKPDMAVEMYVIDNPYDGEILPL